MALIWALQTPQTMLTIGLYQGLLNLVTNCCTPGCHFKFQNSYWDAKAINKRWWYEQMKASMVIFSGRVHMLVTRSPSLRSFYPSKFCILHNILRSRFQKKNYGKVFEKGMRIHILTRVKMHSSTSFNILLAKIGELHLELYALKLAIGFPTTSCALALRLVS